MNALVLGSAEGAGEDLILFALDLDCWRTEPWCMIAINDAGWMIGETLPDGGIIPRIDHWTHLHTEDMPARIEKRRALGGNMDFTTWSRRLGANGETPDRIAPQHLGAGSSGLYAVGIALYELGCEKVVLCGVPMDERPRMGDTLSWVDRDPATGDKDKLALFRPVWEAAFPKLDGRVRSMSGWTRELLGVPTAEWLRTKERAGA